MVDHTHFSSAHIAEKLIRNRTLLMGWVVILSVFWIIPASRLSIDASGVSFTMNDSQSHKEYQAFVKAFGTDDYILIAVKNSLKISNPKLRQRIRTVHERLAAMDSVLQVIDLETIETSGFFKLISATGFWDDKHLSNLRQILPGLGRLISNDMATIAFIVRINNEQLNGFRLESQLKHMKQIIAAAFPEHPRCYAAGIPVIRAAFERYNLESALVFGFMGLIFGILIAFYIFKTMWAALMVAAASLISLIWTFGIMGLFGIDLNLASGLSFGFILVVSTTTVFHILTTYFQLVKIRTKNQALAETFQHIMRPCFMCALTTSAGFLSLTVSSVPMVRQAGIIISMGVMLAFFLTLVTTLFLIPRYLNVNPSDPCKEKEDALEKLINTFLVIGFNRSATCVMAGMVFICALAWGIPKIETIKHLTRPFIKHTQEAADLAYIEHHISTGTSFSVILESKDTGFHTSQFWYDLIEFEKSIKTIPTIVGVESLTQAVFHMAVKFSLAGIRPEKAFHQIQIQSRENNMVQTYFDPKSEKLRLIVHIQTQTSDQVEATLRQVKEQARHIFAEKTSVVLSGQLILLRSQTTDLVTSQIKTLFLALFVITILMMIQLKSVALGMVSLIPNLFPLITIFGIMGWCRIPLDPLTIFAAVISFGLSVDDSIHYLTQFKKEIHLSPPVHTIQGCLEQAYHKTSRALVSTTAVLFFSAMGLLFSSFSHVLSLGILISLASVAALIGDLVFMPAAILTFKPLNGLLSRKIKETTP